MNKRRHMTWREAFHAMAVDARARAKNAKTSPGGPSDPRSVGQDEGVAYAFNVMAEELEHLADDCDPKTALKRLRHLLDLRGQR